MTADLLPHLIELRRRLIYCLSVFSLIFCTLFFYANDLFLALAQPLLALLPSGQSLIAIDVAAPLLTPLKLAINISLLLCMPICLYNTWAFIAPGLHRQERRWFSGLLFASLALFCLGLSFAFWVVLPLLLGFFKQTVPEGVLFMPDISHYLSFVSSTLLAFGLCFQLPIAIILLLKSQLISSSDISKARPYIIVAVFTIAMLLTPPTVVSQCCLALPMWLLFEAGVLVAKWLPNQPAAASHTGR